MCKEVNGNLIRRKFNIKQMICFLFVIFLIGCSTTNTSQEPTEIVGPMSCDELEDPCLQLTFGETFCTYEGPSVIKPGPITFLFVNQSGSLGSPNLMRHVEGKTIQDMIDEIGEEPSPNIAPGWSRALGTWELVYNGNSVVWEGDLQLGIHTMVCVSARDGVYFGGGFSVED